jgi:hypothetical protein
MTSQSTKKLKSEIFYAEKVERVWKALTDASEDLKPHPTVVSMALYRNRKTLLRSRAFWEILKRLEVYCGRKAA